MLTVLTVVPAEGLRTIPQPGPMPGAPIAMDRVVEPLPERPTIHIRIAMRARWGPRTPMGPGDAQWFQMVMTGRVGAIAPIGKNPWPALRPRKGPEAWPVETSEPGNRAMSRRTNTGTFTSARMAMSTKERTERGSSGKTKGGPALSRAPQRLKPSGAIPGPPRPRIARLRAHPEIAQPRPQRKRPTPGHSHPAQALPPYPEAGTKAVRPAHPPPPSKA